MPHKYLYIYTISSILHKNPMCRHNYYPHFVNEETILERLSNLPKANDSKWKSQDIACAKNCPTVLIGRTLDLHRSPVLISTPLLHHLTNGIILGNVLSLSEPVYSSVDGGGAMGMVIYTLQDGCED